MALKKNVSNGTFIKNISVLYKSDFCFRTLKQAKPCSIQSIQKKVLRGGENLSHDIDMSGDRAPLLIQIAVHVHLGIKHQMQRKIITVL